jgi:hypothetical protein
MSQTDPPDPDFESRVRASFNRQRVMQATMMTVSK